jgi:hypothetical protein
MYSKTNNRKQKSKIALLFILWFLLAVSLCILKYVQLTSSLSPSQTKTQPYVEVKELENNTYTFGQLKSYFTSLAQKKGAVYAFEILKRAYIPPNTDLHLLGHVIGNELYKQQGIRGMKYCTQDFRNACSHTIVVGMLLQYGENILSKIDGVCKSAPGGYGAYGLCYHGLGHGVLAYTNYDMEKAANLCKKTRTYGSQTTYAQCIGGTVMEIIGGGDHDKATWSKQSQKYLSNDNPLSLCQSSYIEKGSPKYFCYMYLTPHLFNTAGFNPRYPQNSEVFKRAFPYCDAIPLKNTSEREACFGGFGKEFVVLAKNRDIRNVETMTPSELTTVYNWCKLAPHPQDEMQCVHSAIESLLWGGENSPHAAVTFCSVISESDGQKQCFSYLFTTVKKWIKNDPYKDTVCQLVPQQFKTSCYGN